MKVGFHTFPSGKEYVFVRQGKGKSSDPVFLRNIIFSENTANPREIAIVREWGVERNKHVWEPPKGRPHYWNCVFFKVVDTMHMILVRESCR